MREMPVEYPRIEVGPTIRLRRSDFGMTLLWVSGYYMLASVTDDYPMRPIYRNVIYLAAPPKDYNSEIEERVLRTLIHETVHWAQRLFLTEEDCMNMWPRSLDECLRGDGAAPLLDNMANWVSEERYVRQS